MHIPSHPHRRILRIMAFAITVIGLSRATTDAATTVANPAESVQVTPSPAHAGPADLVDSLNLVFGKQKENRAVHAKGIVLQGRFTPSASAAKISKAPHFKQSVPVTVRFSNFAGLPSIPDSDPMASPRGIAVKFHLPDGSETDLVMHSFNGFPTATADEFHDLFVALGTSGPDVAKPTPADKFLAAHPIAKTFLETQSPPPVSYATITYYGVNSFKFINAKGKARYGRYRFVPVEGNRFLTPKESAAAAPGYLSDEIRTHLANTPVHFHFQVQLSGPGDKIDDPSIAWPETREIVDLGELEVSAVVPDSVAAEKALIFLPAAITAGIEPADPMIIARSTAYSVSYARRHQ